MNKLSQGIFEIDGYEYSRNTTLEDIKALGKYEICGTGEVVKVQSIPNTVRFLDADFVALFYFFAGRLDHLELYPQLPGSGDDPDEEEDDEYGKACFDFCEKLLDENFDDTVVKSRGDNGILYDFGVGSAGIPCPDHNKDFSSGGYIFISFKEGSL